VITDPPLLAGAVHDTTADWLPGVAVTPVGAPGTVDDVGGVTRARSSTTNEVASDESSRPVKEIETVLPAKADMSTVLSW